MKKNLTTRKAIEILKRIKEPETSISLLKLGLVKYVDYMEENRTFIVKHDFVKRNPSCASCIFTAWMLQKNIIDELAKKFLKLKNIKSMKFIP